MNQILEFLAENYIYVTGISALIIIILLIIIAIGNKKDKNKVGNVTQSDMKAIEPQPISEVGPIVPEVSTVGATQPNNFVAEPVVNAPEQSVPEPVVNMTESNPVPETPAYNPEPVVSAPEPVVNMAEPNTVPETPVYNPEPVVNISEPNPVPEGVNVNEAPKEQPLITPSIDTNINGANTTGNEPESLEVFGK